MQRGVIEWCGLDGEWYREDPAKPSLTALLYRMLRWTPFDHPTPRRYRVGNRAVMLWPEERMGEVVEL